MDVLTLPCIDTCLVLIYYFLSAILEVERPSYKSAILGLNLCNTWIGHVGQVAGTPKGGGGVLLLSRGDFVNSKFATYFHH